MKKELCLAVTLCLLVTGLARSDKDDQSYTSGSSIMLAWKTGDRPVLIFNSIIWNL